MCVQTPAHFLKISPQLLASGINEEPMFARLISQCGVQAVHPVFDERIAVGIPVRNLESPRESRQTGFDKLPVGLGARALPALAGRVAINPEFLSSVKRPGFDAPQK